MISLRECTVFDLDAVVDLNETVYENLTDKSILRHNTSAMLASCLAAPNVTLGAWQAGKLVAFGILYVPQDEAENHVRDLNLNGSFCSANQKLFVVRNDYRGLGLQRRLIVELEKIAQRRGINLLCATCAPHNTFSIRNFEAEGYRYALTEKKYGGMLRNLYYKCL
jgi:Acetyltransferase (GNAT) family.